MRLLIYLLAMLTGFSAAEAARPVSALPASVDAAVGQAYGTTAVAVAEQAQVRPSLSARFSVVRSIEFPAADGLLAIQLTTPVLRHDVILG